MRIVHVVGARPNYMKIAPLIRALGRVAGRAGSPAWRVEAPLVHTGQHCDDMSGRCHGAGLWGRLAARPSVRLTAPLGYLDFLSLLADARLAATDSGGIQEETTVLGVPCLTLRDNTERPITVTLGTNRLLGADPVRLAPAVHDVLAAPAPGPRRPPGWDGRAAERTAEAIRVWWATRSRRSAEPS